MFYPGFRIRIRLFSHPGSQIPNPDPNIFFIPDPGYPYYMKSGMLSYFLLASYAFRSKVFVLEIVKKIRDKEKIHSDLDRRSWIQGEKNTGSRIRNTTSSSVTETRLRSYW
jgi:hypothetical protein